MEKNMKILVTGATGRLGRAFVSIFSRKHPGARLRLVVRYKSRLEIVPKNSEVVEADLSKELPAGLCSRVDTVVHFAALVDASAPESELMLQNFEATKKLIDAAKSVGVKRFIFCSSISVFRDTSSNAYGRSKLLAEEYLKKSGIEYVILRPAIIYGPGFREGFEQVISGIKKGKMAIIGSGENHIPLVHVDDVVQAFTLALEKEEVKNEDFDIVGDEKPTQAELFALVAKKLGLKPPSRKMPKSIAYLLVGIDELKARITKQKPKMLRDYVDILAEDRIHSNEKAKKLLGFSPRVTVEQGIGEFVQSLQQQQQQQPEKKP